MTFSIHQKDSKLQSKVNQLEVSVSQQALKQIWLGKLSGKMDVDLLTGVPSWYEQEIKENSTGQLVAVNRMWPNSDTLENAKLIANPLGLVDDNGNPLPLSQSDEVPFFPVTERYGYKMFGYTPNAEVIEGYKIEASSLPQPLKDAFNGQGVGRYSLARGDFHRGDSTTDVKYLVTFEDVENSSLDAIPSLDPTTGSITTSTFEELYEAAELAGNPAVNSYILHRPSGAGKTSRLIQSLVFTSFSQSY